MLPNQSHASSRSFHEVQILHILFLVSCTRSHSLVHSRRGFLVKSLQLLALQLHCAPSSVRIDAQPSGNPQNLFLIRSFQTHNPRPSASFLACTRIFPIRPATSDVLIRCSDYIAPTRDPQRLHLGSTRRCAFLNPSHDSRNLYRHLHLHMLNLHVASVLPC